MLIATDAARPNHCHRDGVNESSAVLFCQITALQAEASKWAEKRDAYAQDSQKVAAQMTEVHAAAEAAADELDRLKADIAHAQERLTAVNKYAAPACCNQKYNYTVTKHVHEGLKTLSRLRVSRMSSSVNGHPFDPCSFAHAAGCGRDHHRA